jgi:protein SCO1/2
MRGKKVFYLTIVLGLPLSLGIAILCYWYVTAVLEKNTLLPSYGTVPPFALTRENEEPFNEQNFKRKVSIVDFIFTECAGTCPMMSTKLSDMQDDILSNEQIQFVSISVDPETDTPQVLSEYGKQFHARPGRWIFATGQKSVIYDLSRNGFHLGLEEQGDDAVIHSEKFILVDDKGMIRGYYDSSDDEAMALLRRDAKILARKMKT